MKSACAVVYVTRSGHSRSLAQEVGKKMGAQVFEIIDLVSRKGFIGYMKSGFQSTTKKSTPIRDPFVHLERFDTIIVVQPVWASSVCPPMRSWLRAHRHELEGKKLALLLSNKGSDPAKVRALFEAEFQPVSALGCVTEKSTREERTQMIDAFVASLTGTAAGAPGSVSPS